MPRDSQTMSRHAFGCLDIVCGLRVGFGKQAPIVGPEGEILAQPVDQFLKLGDVHRPPVPPQSARHKALQARRKLDFGGFGRQKPG